MDYAEIPAVFGWLWNEFVRMPRSGGGGLDRARLIGEDIEFWERRTGLRFSILETELLLELDNVVPKNALGEEDGRD